MADWRRFESFAQLVDDMRVVKAQLEEERDARKVTTNR